MAPPLLPLTRLVVCSACAEHVRSTDETCPHCGTVLGGRGGLLARAAGVALAGVVLSACNGKDTDTGTEDGSSSNSSSGTDAGTESGSNTSDPDTSGATGFETQAAYGVPTSDFTTATTDSSESTGTTNTGTDTVGDTGTDTEGTTADTSGSTSDSSDTGNSSMTGGPEYGVPDTGNEPDYGVPGTT